MMDKDTAPIVIGTLAPCEQYKFRVVLPDTFGDSMQEEIHRAALLETNNTFLECTRNYQAVSWAGMANLAFTDTRSSPRDSRSNFLHVLVCLKTLEISFQRLREIDPDATPEGFTVAVGTHLPREFRKKLLRACAHWEIGQPALPDAQNPSLRSARIGGEYRPLREGNDMFYQETAASIRQVRVNAFRKLSGRPFLKKCVDFAARLATSIVHTCHATLRLGFNGYYRMVAMRILKRMDGPRNIFLYFDARLGRNREVDGYLSWKFSDEFTGLFREGVSPIPFTHLARPGDAWSRAGMRWALDSLRKMEEQPLSGCLVTNYLITPWALLRMRARKRTVGRSVRKQLRETLAQNSDFISQLMYEEFISSANAFAMEVTKGYHDFFGRFAPGVVIQADALSKGARHLTACARQLGFQVIYVADRICTRMRTSNQLIADEGDNPHFPDRCVVFDEVSRIELVRQGLAGDHIYHYHRNFKVGRVEQLRKRPSKFHKVIIFLQDYCDNMSAMISVGEELVRTLPNIKVIFQEHPNFPVCEHARTRLVKNGHQRLRFLKPREAVNYDEVLAMITGYSTAAIPGVLDGVPLIWLRRQVNNSIYGEDYLRRVGLAADSNVEVLSLIRLLIARDPEILSACMAAGKAAGEIFCPPDEHAERSLSAALEHALEDGFAEIASRGGSFAPETLEIIPLQTSHEV